MYNYSAKNNTFYPDSERFVYERYGSWPDDCIPVADSVYDEFAASEPPSGKMRIAGDDGLPKWSDIPAATREKLMTIADAQKSQWLAAANARIAPLADAVELHMATDNEVNQLEIWKKYRVLLTRVDTSTAPNIEWPKQPEN